MHCTNKKIGIFVSLGVILETFSHYLKVVCVASCKCLISVIAISNGSLVLISGGRKRIMISSQGAGVGFFVARNSGKIRDLFSGILNISCIHEHSPLYMVSNV